MNIPARMRAQRDDERGMTLVMVLVCVIVLATVFGAIFGFQGTTLSAQSSLRAKRNADLAGDSAIDTAITRLRYDKTLGVDQSYPSGNCGLPSEVTQPTDPSGAGTVRVTCSAASGSGLQPPTAPTSAGTVVLALGGVLAKGASSSNSSKYFHTIPYCDEQGTSSAYCEAGVYVGSNTPAGVLIAPNVGGATSLVQSNGSIVGPSNGLVAQGGNVAARRSCGNVSAVAVGGGPTPQVNCGNPDGSGPYNSSFFPDPGWLHEWIDAATAPRDPTTGMLQTAGSLPNGEIPTVQRWWDWDPDQTTNRPDPNDITTVTRLCSSDNYVRFVPGTYIDLIAMNKLMANCPSSMFWFSPLADMSALTSSTPTGKYYFDFTDSNVTSTNPANKPYWMEPGTFSQIVAGTPASDGSSGWSDPGACAPSCNWTKTLTPHDYAIDAKWGTGTTLTQHNNNRGDATTGVANGILIDGKVARDQLNLQGSGGPVGQYTADDFEPQVPSGETVGSVKLVVAATALNYVDCTTKQSTTSTTACPAWTTMKLPTSTAAVQSPFIKVTVAGTAPLQNCDVPLSRGALDAHGYLIFDLTTSCGALGGVDKTLSGGAFVGNGTSNKWTPAAVNNLQVDFNVNRADDTYTPTIDIDGFQLQVGYSGYPSPNFPHGCDPNLPGVQWIFGNYSRIQWRQNNEFIELCGSKGVKDSHAIAIDGLAGPRCIARVDPTTIGHAGQPPADPNDPTGTCPQWVSSVNGAPLNAGDANAIAGWITDVPPPLEARSGGEGTNKPRSYKVDMTMAAPQVVDNDAGLRPVGSLISSSNCATSMCWVIPSNNVDGRTNPAAIIGDRGQNAYTNAAFSGTAGTTSVTYTMPSNWIPAGSAIERVRLAIRHAEPVPCAGCQQTLTGMAVTVSTGGGADTSDYDTGSGSTQAIPLHIFTPDSSVTTQNPTDGSAKNYNGPWRTEELGDYTPTGGNCCSSDDIYKQTSTWGATEAREAQLTSDLRTSNALNGATIQIDATGTNQAGNPGHVAIIDGVDLVVDYRPPGQLRPLRGCMTMRTMYGPNSLNRVSPDAMPVMMGLNWNHQGSYDDTTASNRFDSGYVKYSASGNDSAANTGAQFTDTNDCSLLFFYSQSSGQGTRFHTAGDIYAPTASLNLSGLDNQASFADDGVVARQLTLARWTRGPSIPAFGYDGFRPTAPRVVYIEARVGGVRVASVKLTLNDYSGSVMDVGRTLTVQCRERRRSTSCA